MATAPTAEEFTAVKEELAGLKDDLKKAREGSSAFGQSIKQAGGQLEQGLKGFTSGLANGAQGASAFNGAISAGGAAVNTMLSNMGSLGKAFGKLTDFATAYIVRANAQGDALFKSFQDLSKVGGASAEGMTGIFNNMQKLGMTMNQLPEFGAMIAQNSEALAMLGGTVTQGAKQFSEVAAGIQQSGLQSEFQRMGLTTKNINEGTASYLRIQAMNAANSTKTQSELTAGAAEYISQQDRLSRLTGKSADILAKEQEARMGDQRFRALTREQDQQQAELRAIGTEESIAQANAIKAQQQQNAELLDSLKGGMKKGAQDLLSGFVNTPEAQQMMIAMPEMAQTIMSGNFKASETLQKGADDIGKTLNQQSGLAKAGVFDKVLGKFSEYADFEAQQLALRKTGVDAAKTEQDKLKEGADKDINNQVAMRQAQTSTTQAMEQLVQKGVGPLTEAMRIASVKIEENITKIPGLDKKTSVSNAGEGRGMNAPATAGYSSNFNPGELVKFVNDTATALTGPAKPKEITTGKQAHPVLYGNAARLAGPTGSSPVNSGVRANDILQKALSDTVSNPGSTTGTGTGSSSAASPDLTQTIMSLATNMGTQTTSTNELVELARRSNTLLNNILQQSKN
jgi:hypothetical protein